MEAITFTRRLERGKTGSERHELCKEIYEGLHKQIPFPQLLGLTKNKGIRCMRETYEEFRKTGITSPAYFLGMLKSNKTVWN